MSSLPVTTSGHLFLSVLGEGNLQILGRVASSTNVKRWHFD
jgi:hypothetical protein